MCLQSCSFKFSQRIIFCLAHLTSMATNFKSIPQIDVGPLLAKSHELKMIEDPAVVDVVRQLDKACRETGFFYVKGHGISESMLKQVRNISRHFFHLPHEEKLKIKVSSATGYRGYQEVGENITKGMPDHLEAIDLYRETKEGTYGDLGKTMEGLNLWPSNPPNFKSLMEEYINLCTEVSRKIMQGIALALGVSPYEFEGKIAGEPFWITRLLGYPGLSIGNGHHNDNDTGCGIHTDYGLLALLNQDEDITALQVRNLSGEWIWAPPIVGTLVCNIGDMLKILTNGLYESTVHRVINNNPKYRVCVGYFYEPNFDAVIEPLETCVVKSGGVKKEGKAMYGEHLVTRVKKNLPFKLE